ncbi:MFS transporter [Gracilibacillus marinus]|uniref:MFS transporter n=1 Tax=Gracilibacillus marinus TaxID=630535 RepID=A0ABV8VRR1_9BACI
MEKIHRRFWILVTIVAISGFSQGMLLPLIAVIFENSGVSSVTNGLHATSLYIGVLLASPFMEQPLRKYGYKPIIVFGGLLVCISLLMFPLWKSIGFWFLLRLLIGIGDHAVNFAAQTWITAFSPEHKRGRNIAIYGLFFGIGFAVGPLMVPLITIHQALPFILSSIISLIGWLFLLTLTNEKPDYDVYLNSTKDTFKRFYQAWKYGWIAFLPPFTYGFLETTLNGNFPIYGLRIGLEVNHISTLLAAFAIGTIVFQLPLGMCSDKFGRGNTLTVVLFLGCALFLTASFLETYYYGLIICLFMAGMFVGSTFSLGIAYMTDITPKHLLPTGNLLCGVFFSIGSLIGPTLGGAFIQLFKSASIFHIISFLFFIVFVVIGIQNTIHLRRHH